MSKWCFNYESGEYEYIDRDGFSIDRLHALEQGDQRIHCNENQTGTINRRIRFLHNQALSVLPRACVLGDGVVVERLRKNGSPAFDRAAVQR